MNNLPNNWIVKDVKNDVDVYTSPRESSTSTCSFYGMIGESLKVFEIPKPISLTQIIKYFRAGQHGAEYSGEDIEEIIDTLAKNTEEINKISPVFPIYIDKATLRLEFKPKISVESYKEIENLFEDKDPIYNGLEGFLANWDGEEPLLGSVLKDNIFQFWWD